MRSSSDRAILDQARAIKARERTGPCRRTVLIAHTSPGVEPGKVTGWSMGRDDIFVVHRPAFGEGWPEWRISHVGSGNNIRGAYEEIVGSWNLSRKALLPLAAAFEGALTTEDRELFGSLKFGKPCPKNKLAALMAVGRKLRAIAACTP